ncbi:isochorismatase family protein [Streptomyces sp. NPDC056600]|uniref:isochorismatase family protein n=1 Tax=Streptomyces sp. NPDC056600 TaxID=3345874 RepID=UPI0036AE0EE3
MSTLEGRLKSGLLVVDVQNAVVAEAYERDAVVGVIGALVEKARAERVPVVWVRHQSEDMPAGGDGWQIVPELRPAAGEPVVEKEYGDAFEATRLDAVLAERGVARLFVTGAQTDMCVRSTLHGALARGYDAMLVSDAHTTVDLTRWGAPAPAEVVAHTNLYWSFQKAPGRVAGTLESKEIDFWGA